MTDESERYPECAAVLLELIEALRDIAPRMNEELPVPQRMAITEIRTSDVEPVSEGRYGVTLSLRAGHVPTSYQVELSCVNKPLRLTIFGDEDVEEQIELATRMGEEPIDRDVRAFYDALATDIAGHFGADS